MVIELALRHLFGGGFNGRKLFLRHFFRLQQVIGPGGGQLQGAKGADDLPGHGFQVNADGEVLVAPLGLGSPVFVRRDLHFPHGVVLNAIFHCVSPHIQICILE